LIKSAFFNRVLWPWRIFHRFIPDEIHRLRRFLVALGRARLSYAPKAYHDRITCFLLEEFPHNHKKVIGDWSDIAAGGLDVRFVPGTILSMWTEPHVQILAEKLKACLDDAQTGA
jgi:thioesterase domain-containing protein